MEKKIIKTLVSPNFKYAEILNLCFSPFFNFVYLLSFSGSIQILRYYFLLISYVVIF
jgi:hypothetical protein